MDKPSTFFMITTCSMTQGATNILQQRFPSSKSQKKELWIELVPGVVFLSRFYIFYQYTPLATTTANGVVTLQRRSYTPTMCKWFQGTPPYFLLTHCHVKESSFIVVFPVEGGLEIEEEMCTNTKTHCNIDISVESHTSYKLIPKYHVWCGLLPPTMWYGQIETPTRLAWGYLSFPSWLPPFSSWTHGVPGFLFLSLWALSILACHYLKCLHLLVQFCVVLSFVSDRWVEILEYHTKKGESLLALTEGQK